MADLVKETLGREGRLRCLRCRSLNLVKTGKEAYRFECENCGQHYFLVMQLMPVEAPPKKVLGAGEGSGTE